MEYLIDVGTDAVADTPVNGTPISSVSDPTLDVASIPIKFSIPSSTLPQPFSPQSRVPQPGLTSTVGAPTAEVVDKAERATTGASP